MTIKEVINPQSDYKLHTSVSKVEATGEINLLIESTWAGAKNPDERQAVLNLTLDRREMTKLGWTIIDGALLQ